MEDGGATRDCGGGRAGWREADRRGGEGVGNCSRKWGGWVGGVCRVEPGRMRIRWRVMRRQKDSAEANDADGQENGILN